MSELRYKLTNQDGYTYNKTQWGPGTSYTTSGIGELCGPGWLHCYSNPVLAIMMNPHHANFKNPKLAMVECSGQCKGDHGLKEGWTTMTFKEWLPVPTITTTQRVAFAILCAKQVTTDPAWHRWADNWLSGTDRTSTAAAATYAYAAATYAAAAYAAATYATAATATAYAADAAATYADIDLVALVNKALEY